MKNINSNKISKILIILIAVCAVCIIVLNIFSNNKLNHSGVIPKGGTYYVGVTSLTLNDYTGATAIYTSGDKFPNINDGDVYVYGDYEYRYNMRKGLLKCYEGYGMFETTWEYQHDNYAAENIGGWSAAVIDKSKSKYKPILETINNHPIVYLNNAFANCNSLTVSPRIPSSVTNMDKIFTNCISLKTAPKIPETVISMDGTFENCDVLSQAPIIPNNVINMNGTFRGCSSLIKAPVLPNSVVNMELTFEECTSLTIAPEIPKNVKNMSGTFRGCTSLIQPPNMSNANNLESLYGTFKNCTSLKTASVIPESVTIMDYTFDGCTSLIEAPLIPDGVTIMRGTFSGCTSLTTVHVIPNSVKEMDYIFDGCTSLTGKITINANPGFYNFQNCFNGTKQEIILVGSSVYLFLMSLENTIHNVRVGDNSVTQIYKP